jgi:DNA-binding response OmpR family regulator
LLSWRAFGDTASPATAMFQVNRFTDKNSNSMPSIVLIDDDAELQNLLKLHLTAVGYSVRIAASAKEGMSAIHSKHPDLILTDISMPDMDGFELLKTLQHDEATSGIPVIFLTGTVDHESHVRGMKMGATAYLEKPIQRRDLLQSVSAALQGVGKSLKD